MLSSHLKEIDTFCGRADGNQGSPSRSSQRARDFHVNSRLAGRFEEILISDHKPQPAAFQTAAEDRGRAPGALTDGSWFHSSNELSQSDYDPSWCSFCWQVVYSVRYNNMECIQCGVMLHQKGEFKVWVGETSFLCVWRHVSSVAMQVLLLRTDMGN